ncbi:MAG TPA: hypothetical protein VF857_11065 [Spirochaetota bacterium]
MKRVLLGAILSAFLITPSFAVVYEASSLHDAVGRSETVQDLFFQRWETIIDRQQYFDLFGKINWIPGFKVNAIDRATGEKKVVDMRLVRTYGSMTVNLPVLGGYDGDFSRRLVKGSSQKSADGTEEQKDESTGLVKPKNLIIGFTMTGFHYGLTRSTEVDRGSSGSDSVTDYKYTQFFDDIFALSLVYMPYLYVHGGLIVNNQIDPNNDGTMSYTKSRNGFPQRRYFVASNFLSFLDVNATTTSGKFEKIGGAVEVTKLTGLLMKMPSIAPRVTLSYKMLRYFNDQGYEAVWVGSSVTRSGVAKNDFMSSSDRQHAILHTFSILVAEDLDNIFLADFFTEFQHCEKTLIDKRTNREIDLALTREIRASVGINFLGFNKTNNDSLVAKFGVGHFWDPGIAVQRKSGSGYAVTGWLASIKYEHPLMGAEFMVNYNYSQELRKLIEATDKFAIEGSFYVRI